MTSTWSAAASTIPVLFANPAFSFRPALLPVVILVAGAALLGTPSAARADCRSACQSDYYACLHVSSTGTCSHRRSMCTNSCYAKGGGRGDSFGAIAYSRSTGAHGYSHRFGSQAQAERRAVSECGKSDCEVLAWFNNGACGALATNGKGTYGGAWGRTREEAERKALANCSDREGCTIKRLICSP
jgi:serine/threonine-protein kinase